MTVQRYELIRYENQVDRFFLLRKSAYVDGLKEKHGAEDYFI